MRNIVEKEEEKGVTTLQGKSREKETIASETQLANLLHIVVDDHLVLLSIRLSSTILLLVLNCLFFQDFFSSETPW